MTSLSLDNTPFDARLIPPNLKTLRIINTSLNLNHLCLSIYQYPIIYLDLTKNNISLLPVDFGTCLKSCQTLILRHNRLSELPTSVLSMNLIHLDISFNKFTTLPKASTCEYLYIGNKISNKPLYIMNITTDSPLPLKIVNKSIHIMTTATASININPSHKIKIGSTTIPITDYAEYQINDFHIQVSFTSNGYISTESVIYESSYSTTPIEHNIKWIKMDELVRLLLSQPTYSFVKMAILTIPNLQSEIDKSGLNKDRYHKIAQLLGKPAVHLPSVTLPKIISKTSFLLAADINIIAQQLTLIENDLFKKITPHDLLTNSPVVKQSIERFNATTSWLTSEISYASDRVLVISRCVQLARACIMYNNLQGAVEVISTLNSAAVARMKNSFAGLSPEIVYDLNKLAALLSIENNSIKYREHIMSCQAPTIPYLGAILKDLIFIKDGNIEMKAGMINWTKKRMLISVTDEVERCKGNYPFVKNAEVYNSLLYLTYHSDNSCYLQSRKVEK